MANLGYDRDEEKNAGIFAERLSPEEIAFVEQSDQERSDALKNGCDKYINEDYCNYNGNHLFYCGAGFGSFAISYDGKFRLCPSLWDPDTIYDLRSGTVKEAFEKHTRKVKGMRSENRNFLEKCRRCPIITLCLMCPAHAYLEKGSMDAYVEYFCKVAHARAAALGYTGKHKNPEKEMISAE